MTNGAGLLRSRTVKVAGVLLLAATVTIVLLYMNGYRLIRNDPNYHVKTAMTVTDIGSAEGQRQVAAFNSLSPEPFKLTSGTAAFLDLTWTNGPRHDSHCQVQLAVHAPDGWRLQWWASKHDIADATINSWGIVAERHAELKAVQHTIALDPQPTGRAIVVWQINDEATTDINTIRAYLVHACGNHDKLAPVQEIRVDSGT